MIILKDRKGPSILKFPTQNRKVDVQPPCPSAEQTQNHEVPPADPGGSQTDGVQIALWVGQAILPLNCHFSRGTGQHGHESSHSHTDFSVFVHRSLVFTLHFLSHSF